MQTKTIVILAALLACCLAACDKAKDPGDSPEAGFTATPLSGGAPLEVMFTSTSSGTITSRLWDFGDDQTSAEVDPVHTYTAAGVYTVTLTVEGPEGSDTETKADYITVDTPAGPTADFEGTPLSGSAPLEVTFTDLSTGTNVHSWTWDFGDEGSSSEQNPTHTYTAAGTYDVTLEVTDDAGTGSETKTAYIEVTSSGTGGTGGPTGSGTADIPASPGHGFAYHVPPCYSEDTPIPVFYTLHGAGGTATNMRDAWIREAEANCFIVLALQSSSAGWSPGVDGAALQDMVDHADTIYNLDTKRRYLHGYSAGAHWSYSLGLFNNMFFAAFAVFAGTMQYAIDGGIWPLDYDGGDRRIPVCIHHGDADTVVPVSHAREARANLETFGHPVFYREIPGGTHAYPISINQEVWESISTHALP